MFQTQKWWALLILVFASACDAQESEVASDPSFEDVMLKFMLTEDASNFYVPDYQGMSNEVRRLQFYIEQKCGHGCSVGVFARSDQYTIELVEKVCAIGSTGDIASLTAILRRPAPDAFADCTNVRATLYDQL